MKALVLCGGIPQIELIKLLKAENITVVLADMNEKVSARMYADIFYPVSTLDVEGIKKVAVKENVDFLITVCADQVLEVVAQVSEELNLPCYIDYATATNVSKKSFMKKIFFENGIPTSKYVIMSELNINKLEGLKYPLIVKPVDSYSSRGVKKVFNTEELSTAFCNAVNISRTKTAIIEEFVEGDEITVDIYVEDGQAHILCLSNLEKIPGNEKFVIYRTTNPAQITNITYNKINNVAQDICKAFNLKNCPMLIQLIVSGEDISIVEFCARTGGGDKFRLIKKVADFDVIKAVLDLSLGKKPHIESIPPYNKYIINEFLYCHPGIFDHLEGFDEALKDGYITEYYQLKTCGTELKEISSSGDRIAFFTVEGNNIEDVIEKHRVVNNKIKVIDQDGKDILRHDLLCTLENKG